MGEGSTRKIMEVGLTAVYQKVPEGYTGFVEELPGANTQGETLEEARANLREASALVLEANRSLAEESLAGQDVIREPWRALLASYFKRLKLLVELPSSEAGV